jgi:hypothetical protein
VIPARKNAQHWKATLVGGERSQRGAQEMSPAGLEHLEEMEYHRTSLVETKLDCFKSLGERVMARMFERQVVELHVRVTLLKRFLQLDVY